jgi:hypothetical protein
VTREKALSKLPILLLITGACLLSACFHGSNTVKTTKAELPLPPVQSSNSASDNSVLRVRTGKGTEVYIITRGVGYPDLTLTNKQKLQRSNKAKRDALIEAQTKMLFIVSDFMMKSGMTVGRKMQDDNDFTTKVNNAVNRAEVTGHDCTNESVCTVTLRLEKRAFEKAIGMEVSR